MFQASSETEAENGAWSRSGWRAGRRQVTCKEVLGFGLDELAMLAQLDETAVAFVERTERKNAPSNDVVREFRRCFVVFVRIVVSVDGHGTVVKSPRDSRASKLCTDFVAAWRSVTCRCFFLRRVERGKFRSSRFTKLGSQKLVELAELVDATRRDATRRDSRRRCKAKFCEL